MNSRFALLLLFSVAMAEEVTTTSRVFRIHDVGFADPAVISEVARAALSDGSRIVVDAPRRRLLVYATDAEHNELEKLVRSAAAPPPIVRIEVRRRAAGRASELAATADGEGTLILRDGRPAGHWAIRPRLGWRAGENSEDVVQTLTVMSGRSATLQVGEEVPYLEWLQQCAMGWGVSTVAVRWRSVGAQLAIEPTVIGQGAERRVLIRLIPELSGVSDQGPLRWRFERVATELVAVPGETVQFGGSARHAEFYDRFLIGIRREGRHDKILFELTPIVVDALPPVGAERSEGAPGR